MDEQSYLLEWAKYFFKHKDLIRKDIVEIKEETNKIVITFKTKKQFTIPLISLSFFATQEYSKEEWITLITFNTKDNFDTLIKDWKILKEYPKLIIYFINPESLGEKKWHISPRTHSIIADDSSLKQGLKSIFSSVDPLTPAQIKRIIK
jgi:hypothetical protein